MMAHDKELQRGAGGKASDIGESGQACPKLEAVATVPSRIQREERMMRATIRERVSGARLRDAVPPLYRDEIVKGIDPAGVYSLVLCAHNPRDVIHSAPLVQAFRRLEKPAENGVIVVGTVFTEEAKAIAVQHGARIVALHKALWTDESARARQR